MKKFPLVLLAALFFATSTYSAEFEGVGGLPAHPDPADARTKDWFLYTLSPGDIKDDELLVVNNSDKENKVILYPADSTPSTDGGFALKQSVEPKLEVGKWITLSKTELTLPPFGSEKVPFHIQIPKDAVPDVGEHTGGILIQKADQQSQQQGGLTLSTRVGVRVYVTIPGTVVKKLDMQKFTVMETSEKKMATAIVTVRNSGNVSQDISISLRVHSDWEWLKEIPFLNTLVKDFPLENVRELQVLRGDALTSNFEFREPAFGKVTVEALVRYDHGTKTLGTKPIELHVKMDGHILLFLILLTAFLLVLILYFVLRHREKKLPKKPSLEVPSRKAAAPVRKKSRVAPSRTSAQKRR